MTEKPGDEPTVPDADPALDSRSLFTLACRASFADGAIDAGESRILNGLLERLSLTPAVAAEIAAWVRDEVGQDAGTAGGAGPLETEALYRRACELVWADGRVEAEERRLLHGLAAALGLDTSTATRLLLELQPSEAAPSTTVRAARPTPRLHERLAPTVAGDAGEVIGAAAGAGAVLVSLVLLTVTGGFLEHDGFLPISPGLEAGALVGLLAGWVLLFVGGTPLARRLSVLYPALCQSVGHLWILFAADLTVRLTSDPAALVGLSVGLVLAPVSLMHFYLLARAPASGGVILWLVQAHEVWAFLAPGRYGDHLDHPDRGRRRGIKFGG